jgi:hypothetical protein
VSKFDLLTELKSRKESADREWNTVFSDALKGKVNQYEILFAMQMSNLADKALICYEQNRGVKNKER